MNGEKRKRGANPRWDCPPHCSLPHPLDSETEAHGGEALFVRCWQAQGAQVLGCDLCPPRYVASPGSDLCTRPSSASEASRAVKRRHLCSRPRCCRRSRVVVRRSGDSISHSGLSGHRAQSPEPPPLPPPLPVTLTPPRAAWPWSCPRGTQVRFPWAGRGHFVLPGGRTQMPPLASECTVVPLLAARGSSATPGPQSLDRNTHNQRRKGTSGRSQQPSESGVVKVAPGASLPASSHSDQYHPAPLRLHLLRSHSGS